jgi:hypothetical protein
MNKEYSSFIDYLRVRYVDNLRMALTKLKDSAGSTLKKIEEQGTSGYYSGNSDIHRYCEDAWRASWALCELKRLEVDVDEYVQNEVARSLEVLAQEAQDNNGDSVEE